MQTYFKILIKNTSHEMYFFRMNQFLYERHSNNANFPNFTINLLIMKKKNLSSIYEIIWFRNCVLYCIIILIIDVVSILNPSPKSEIVQSYFDIIIFITVKYFFLFLHNHFLTRKYLLNKHFKKYFFLFVFYITFFSICDYVTTTILGFKTYLLTEYVSCTMLTIFGLSFYIIHHWIINNIISTKKKLLKSQNELNFLKQQISPHFLFNSLNNLYSASLCDSHKISEKIIELSDLLRYQIDSLDKDYIEINEEIKFVNAYFKYTSDKLNNIKINFEIEGEFSNLKIPPLIFLPLIENAVKYSIETKEPFINCKLILENDKLIFMLKNSYSTNIRGLKNTGTGLKNSIERLDLMKFKYIYKVDTSTENLYKVELNLWYINV